jgi:tryptophan synthase alpha chain
MTSTMSMPGDDEEIRNHTDEAILAGTISDEEAATIHQLLDEKPGRYTWDQIVDDAKARHRG